MIRPSGYTTQPNEHDATLAELDRIGNEIAQDLPKSRWVDHQRREVAVSHIDLDRQPVRLGRATHQFDDPGNDIDERRTDQLECDFAFLEFGIVENVVKDL